MESHLGIKNKKKLNYQNFTFSLVTLYTLFFDVWLIMIIIIILFNLFWFLCTTSCNELSFALSLSWFYTRNEFKSFRWLCILSSQIHLSCDPKPASHRKMSSWIIHKLNIYGSFIFWFRFFFVLLICVSKQKMPLLIFSFFITVIYWYWI